MRILSRFHSAFSFSFLLGFSSFFSSLEGMSLLKILILIHVILKYPLNSKPKLPKFRVIWNGIIIILAIKIIITNIMMNRTLINYGSPKVYLLINKLISLLYLLWLLLFHLQFWPLSFFHPFPSSSLILGS